MDIAYRTRQFWNALWAEPAPGEIEQLKDILAPKLMALFLSMQPGEQAHSLKILRGLLARGYNQPDLQAAALLHDVGKVCYPLALWERVFIVLVASLFPKQPTGWGQPHPGNWPRTWRRALVVAVQHPAWGADLAAQAGASPLAVALIRCHQAALPCQEMLLTAEAVDMHKALKQLDDQL